MQLEMLSIKIQVEVLNHALISVLLLVKRRDFQTVTIMLVYKTGRRDSSNISRFFFKFCFLNKTRNECYCGQMYGKHNEAADNACNRACPVKPFELCGGRLANSVWKVNHNYVRV
jgi:hypothetical protein